MVSVQNLPYTVFLIHFISLNGTYLVQRSQSLPMQQHSPTHSYQYHLSADSRTIPAYCFLPRASSSSAVTWRYGATFLPRSLSVGFTERDPGRTHRAEHSLLNTTGKWMTSFRKKENTGEVPSALNKMPNKKSFTRKTVKLSPLLLPSWPAFLICFYP